jgi:hypothetical protein
VNSTAFAHKAGSSLVPNHAGTVGALCWPLPTILYDGDHRGVIRGSVVVRRIVFFGPTNNATNASTTLDLKSAMFHGCYCPLMASLCTTSALEPSACVKQVEEERRRRTTTFSAAISPHTCKSQQQQYLVVVYMLCPLLKIIKLSLLLLLRRAAAGGGSWPSFDGRVIRWSSKRRVFF